MPPIPNPATSAVMSIPIFSMHNNRAIDQIADLVKNLMSETAFFTALFFDDVFNLFSR